MNKKLPLPKKLDEKIDLDRVFETQEPSYEEIKIKDLEATVEALQKEIEQNEKDYSLQVDENFDNSSLISQLMKEIEQLKLDNARLVRDKQEIEDFTRIIKMKSDLHVETKLHFMERIAVQSPFVVNRFRVATGWIYTFQTPTGLTSVLETDSK